jgi:methionyl-tRNA formyltransferase
VRIVLFGYGEMGATGLEFLLAQREEVAAVITHRDDPAEKRWYRSLAQVATAAGVPVLYGEEIDLLREVERLGPELILSFYYRSMIPMDVLHQAPAGAMNLHGSLLPRLRGRAPINWALVECEEETGVTLHHMVKSPDAGDIVAQRGFKIGPRDTAKDLFFRAVEETKLLLRDIWPSIHDGTAPRIPQNPLKATYRGRRRPEDGKIDWRKPAREIDGLVRAVTDPFPGAFTSIGGRKLMIWQGHPAPGGGTPGAAIGEALIATGEGAFQIERCEFADDRSTTPKIPKGTKLGDH